MDHTHIGRELFGVNDDLDINITRINDKECIVTYENNVVMDGNRYSTMNACEAISTPSHVAIVASATIYIVPRNAVVQYSYKKPRLSLYLIWFVLTLFTILINLYIANPDILTIHSK